MIGAHAQIVRHPLPDALGVIVVDVAGTGANQRNHDKSQCCEARNLQLVAAVQQWAHEFVQAVWQFVMIDDIVDDDLERPGIGQAHRRLDQHGRQNDQELAAVRTN